MENSEHKFEQLIVVGGTGQIGSRVIESARGSACLMRDAKIIATSRETQDGFPAGPLSFTVLEQAKSWSRSKNAVVHWRALDLESKSHALEAALGSIAGLLKPGVSTALVLAAAFTNVDGCETDPARCKRVNEANTIAVLDWARRTFGARLVFYSTDYVFDGEAGPYKESAKRSAISHYGRAKAAVEAWLETNAPDALIVRTTGVFDYLPGSKNFLMQMLELLGEGKKTRISPDQFANPVWAGDVARATVDLLERGASGIYNVAGGSQLARTEFARAIASVFNRDAALIEPARTADLGQKARRPLKGGLVIDKLARELGWAPMDAVTALQFLKSRYLKSGK
ncbi:MAG: SDR family oxidoreductase [Deltaproteobacteria bacterium]|nr:SDR family oxidoreductase [Deltaproteobacteria bacterium]